MAQVERKITQVNKCALARACSLDRSYVSQLLNGKRDPGLGVAKRVAREIGVTLDEFAGYLERRTVMVAVAVVNMEAVN